MWLYEKGNFDAFRDELSQLDWDSILNEEESIDTCVSNFTESLLTVASKCIPNKIITIRQNDLPWLDNNTKKLMRKRKRLRIKANKTRSDYYWSKYKIIRNTVVSNLRNARKAYFDMICGKINSSKFGSKDWWKLTKQLTESSTTRSISIVTTDEGTVLHDDFDKANLLNEFFCRQSTIIESGKNLPTITSDMPQVLENVIITPDDVKDVLKNLDTSKAQGPDFISPRILKEAADILTPHLCRLYNLSLNSKHFPSAWKIANVIPIHKKDDQSKVGNYRPISLLSILGKIFEKCVYKYIYNFIVSNKLLTPHQSGFTKGDSTVNQLLHLSNEFSKALDNGKEIRVIFFDISKAFDRVWHRGLIYKLKTFGIRGNILQWIENYLSSRKQKVLLNGKESNILSIKAGVPQGSILGPLLFLVFINDIVAEVDCSIKLFADDTSIYMIIDNPLLNAIQLNQNLNKIHNCSKKWLVNFNPQKTETLLISRKTFPTYHPPLFMNNTPIQEVSEHKHLGLIFDTSCQWKSHIDYILEKASNKLKLLRALKFQIDRKSLQTMYFSFIRPVIEYSDIVWDNCTQTLKEKLEKINIEAARIVTGATKLTSLKLLYKESGWPTLEKRREEQNCYNILKWSKA